MCACSGTSEGSSTLRRSSSSEVSQAEHAAKLCVCPRARTRTRIHTSAHTQSHAYTHERTHSRARTLWLKPHGGNLPGEWPGIAKLSTLEIASLSTTKAEACGFVASAYQIHAREWHALQAREEEFAFVAVPFVRLEAGAPALAPTGFMCTEVSPVLVQMCEGRASV